MKRLSILLLIIFSGCQQKKEMKFQAPLFNDLGNYEIKISTSNEGAQKFFTQGIMLAYGFNHGEAARSFREATRLDSNCAICYWGEALVYGPHINAMMEDSVYSKAYAAIQKATQHSGHATSKEKALIEALSKRYPTAEPVADRSEYDRDYAEAMKAVQKQFPDDDDIASLTAEALMDVHPWDYWLKDGTPRPWTPEILSLLEEVLKRNEDHPGANHFYIHAVEASKDPGRALPCADRLRTMVPGAGHLVHMPAHIYLRVGKYADASLANEKAIKADSSYFSQCHAQGLYPAAYAPHNIHFLFVTASFEGRSKDAISAAEHTAGGVDRHMMYNNSMGALQQFYTMAWISYVRFGEWDKILAVTTVDSITNYSSAILHYARGYAQLGKRNVTAAEKEWKLLAELAKDTLLREVSIFGLNNGYDLANIGSLMLKGEIEAKKNNPAGARKYFEEAIRIEDALNYNEPPDWFFPVRHAYGAVLLEYKKYPEAEKVFRDDLGIFKDDPWSLFGLYQSLEAQNKKEEARVVKSKFDEMWKHADFELKSARIL